MTARLCLVVGFVALFVLSCSSDSDLTGSEPEPTETAAPATPSATTPALATPSATATAPSEAGSVSTSCRGDGEGFTRGRTDVDASGNRLAPGSIDLLAAPMITADLPASPAWVVPFFAEDDPCAAHWYVTLDDGRAVTVDPTGAVTDAGDAVAPPETGLGSLRSANDDLVQFDNPLPDSRVVTFGQWTAALVDPTDRYGHGVLGDRIEAGAVEVIDTVSGDRTRIVIDAPSVIEGISPMFVDVDDDAVPELLVTVSNSDDGARLALYNLDGTLRAQSEPIGLGNRWRNQLGAGWFGPDASYAIVDVRTPHLDGVVEFFTINGDQLERVANISGYTSHTLGSRNLDLGILVDADADKVTEVVLPTRDLGSLAIIDRVGDDAVEAGRIDLGGSLSTNIATQWIEGQAWLAAGTRDGRLLIFGDPGR